MMNQGVNGNCFLVLQSDVFVQFQSIQLATKLDTNAQMEMFFQLYHCVKSTHFKAEEVGISIRAVSKWKKFTKIPKDKLPSTEEINSKRQKCDFEDESSNNNEEINSPAKYKSNRLPSDCDTQTLDLESPSVNSLANREKTVISNTSRTHRMFEKLVNNRVHVNCKNQQILDSANTGQMDVETSLNIDSRESCGLDMKVAVPSKHLEASPMHSEHTYIRKGRRKSAPKRAAPAEDGDNNSLEMQGCVDDEDECLNKDAMESTADEDRLNTSSNSEMMSKSYLPQEYTKDTNCELPTMVRGTNYRPMIVSPSKLRIGISPICNNREMSKNVHQNSVSAGVLKNQSFLRTKGMGLNKTFITSGMHDSSADCEPETDDTDQLSDCGDTSEDFSCGSLLKCDFCSFTSHRRYNLNRHRRIHTGNMFKCEICGRKFNEPGKLKSHSCKTLVSKSQNKPTYTCDICSTLGLKTIETLRQHVQLEHGIDETYVCISCNPQVVFHSPHEFKSHLETLHTVGRCLSTSLCNECGREFKYLRSLQKHKQNCLIGLYNAKTAAKVAEISCTSLNTD